MWRDGRGVSKAAGQTLFISWSVRHGRSASLAAALGAEDVYFGVRVQRRRILTPARYASSAVQTLQCLLKRRPAAVMVMAPPLPLAIVALAYCRLAKTPLIIDAHTGAVRSKRSGRDRRVFRLVARPSTATLVTNSQLAVPLQAHGIHAIVLHDPVPSRRVLTNPSASFYVVAPLSWAPDEPIEDIIETAQRCPSIRFVATGSAPAAIRQRHDLPSNLELSGHISDDEFVQLLDNAGAVLALTNREATMQRAGYEAMAAGRPVIASDRAVLREFFGDSALYARDADDLVRGVAECRARTGQLAEAMVRRREWAQVQFERGLADVGALIPPRAEPHCHPGTVPKSD